jgi:hypothetical protein
MKVQISDNILDKTYECIFETDTILFDCQAIETVFNIESNTASTTAHTFIITCIRLDNGSERPRHSTNGICCSGELNTMTINSP